MSLGGWHTLARAEQSPAKVQGEKHPSRGLGLVPSVQNQRGDSGMGSGGDVAVG